MLKTVTFFGTEKDLSALTGLDHDGLWNAGFDLDDWDWGFVCTDPFDDDRYWHSDRQYQDWMLDRMDSYCVGYKHTIYQGFHYYMLYHS